MYLDMDVKEGEWFNFFGSHVDETTGEIVYEEPVKDARVKVRSMAPFIEERISGKKRQYEHVLNPKSRSMERLPYYPEQTAEEVKAERDDLWDYIIETFENFKDKKTQKDITCDKANKIKMMKVPVFDRFIARVQQILTTAGAEAQETETKNSLTGSSSQTNKLDPEKS